MWPYETCKAGTALVNLLQLYPAQVPACTPRAHRVHTVTHTACTRHARAHTPPPPHTPLVQRTATRDTFERLLVTYARAHTRSHAEGLSPPHVDEDLHPDDGYWITR